MNEWPSLASARQEQEAHLHAAGLTVGEQPGGPCQPAARGGHLIRVHQLECEPERATHSPLRLAEILNRAVARGRAGA